MVKSGGGCTEAFVVLDTPLLACGGFEPLIPLVVLLCTQPSMITDEDPQRGLLFYQDIVFSHAGVLTKRRRSAHDFMVNGKKSGLIAKRSRRQRSSCQTRVSHIRKGSTSFEA